VSDVKICPTCGTEYPVSERFCPRDGSALKGQNAGADLVGTVIAERYHIMRKLGEGGMGAVYLAEHVKMGRKSAIKVMNPGMSKDADAIARFNREASNASRMNHPNICAIYDFGETPEGLIYLAMEFIEGDSLTKLIEQHGALPPARAASILHQTADALQVAHDYGIVHRDLKPDNIMIAKGRDGSDVVKVVDFGIAKAHTSDAQKVTKTGLVVGTPEYMSPEQLSGDKLDGRSDIYSLALVGFNMLTGRLPFPSETAQEAMIMRLTDSPKTLADMRPDVAWPAELLQVMDKALARTAAERYQKAGDFGREFSMAIDAMPSTAAAEAGTMIIGAQPAAGTAPTAAIPRTRVASGADQAGARAAKLTPASTPVASGASKGLMAGVGFALVAVISVGAYVIMNGGPDSTSDPAPTGTPEVPPLTQKESAGPQLANNDGKATPPDRNPGGAGDPPARGTGGEGGRGAANPPPTNPTGGRATDGRGESTEPSVASVLAQVERTIETRLNDTTASAGLLAVGDALFTRATPPERARIYFARAVFNYQLGQNDNARDAAICRNANSALAGTGLTGSQVELLRGMMNSTGCQ
jgi:serine/threonine-protein kinase